MRQITIEMDEMALETIEGLRKFFGVGSRSAAIRRAITLACVLAPTADRGRVMVRDQQASGDSYLTVVVAR